MRNRLPKLLVVVVVALFAARTHHAAHHCEFALELGQNASAVRQVELLVSDAKGNFVENLTLDYPQGALPEERHQTRLAAGPLDVAGTVSSADGTRRMTSTQLRSRLTYYVQLAP